MSTAASLVGRSTALLRQDEPESALECAQEALDAARKEGTDKAVEVSALCASAEACIAMGEASRAAEFAKEANALAKAACSKLLEASSLLVVAKTELLGHKEARGALAALRDVGATWGETAVLLALAEDAAKASGAESCARRWIEEATSQGDRWQEAFGLLTIAVAAMPEAVSAFLSSAKQLGVLPGAAYEAISAVQRLHSFGGSVRDLEESQRRLEVAMKAGDRQKQALALLDVGAAKFSRRASAQVTEVGEAVSQLERLGCRDGAAAAKLEASRLRLAAGRPVEALKEARAAASAFKDLGNLAGDAAAQSACALAHLALGQIPEAVAAASTAPHGLAERGLRRECANALLAASQVYLAGGERDRALQVGLEAAAVLRDVGDSRGEAFALLREVAASYVAMKEVDSALQVASAGLRLLRAAEDLPGEVNALQATARIHLSRGDTEPALRILQEVLGLCKDSQDYLEEADTQAMVAQVYMARSEGREALAAAQAGLEAAKKHGDTYAEARALLAVAKVLKASKDCAAASEEARKSLALFQKLGDRSGELQALSFTWAAQTGWGAKEAGMALKQANKAFLAAGDMQAAAEALLEAASADLAAGLSESSADLAHSAVDLFRKMDHTKGEVEALREAISAELASGRQENAVKIAVEVVSLFKRRHDVHGQAESTSRLAKVYLECGQPKEALSEVGESRLLFQKLAGPQSGEAAVLLDIGVHAHIMLNDPPRAVAMAEEAMNLYRRLGDRAGEAAALQASAKVCVQKGDNSSAIQAARQSVAVLARARLAREEAEAHQVMARVHLVRLEPREAVASAAQALTLLRRPGDEGHRVEALEVASWAHSMGLDPSGGIGAAEEAIALCRRIGGARRLATSLQALAEAQLVKREYAAALTTSAEALKLARELGDDGMLEARLLELSSYARIGRSQEKKKGLMASPKQALIEAKDAAQTLDATGDRRLQAEAKYLLAKAHLQVGNGEAAQNEAHKAYEYYGTLRDGSGAGWSALLISACCLKSPARLMTASAAVGQEMSIPAPAHALAAALVAHSTFRRIGDEEGEEAALKAIADVRALQEGASENTLECDIPRPRPLPSAVAASAPSVEVNPYHELVGARRLPFRTGFVLPKPEVFPLDATVSGTEEEAKGRPSPVSNLLENFRRPEAEARPAARSALASLDNWENRFDRKAWHNVKATMSGLWEYPDMGGKPEPNVLMSAEFVNGWLEGLLAPERVDDK